jgi:uncharacterized protein YdhG (YjbR/CyaY superfamily)
MKADQASPKNIDAYIAGFPRDVQRILKRVRGTIRKAMPGAEEVISYRIPAYKLHGRTVLYFAGWKRHYSLYPYNARVAAAFRDDVASYEVSKGTIRFPLGEPVPLKLIEGIARFRAREAAGGGRAKAAVAKKR